MRGTVLTYSDERERSLSIHRMGDIVSLESCPPDTIALVQRPRQKRPLTEAERHLLFFGTDVEKRAILSSAFEVHGVIMRNLRHDCPFQLCQLSAGHPPPHCCTDGSGLYLMVDEDGRILREL